MSFKVIEEPGFRIIDEDENKGADIYDMLSGDVSATTMLDSVINPVREFAGGASYQLADEAEAFARSMVDRYAPRTEADKIAEQFGGEKKYISYEDFKQEIDEERAGWREENEGAALALEIAGGFMGPGGLLGKLGAGKTPMQTAIRSAGIGSAEGAVYGFGEGTNFTDRLERAAMYGGMGFVGGGLIGGGIHKIASKVKEAGAAAADSRFIARELGEDEIADELKKRYTAAVVDLRRSGAALDDIDPYKIVKQAALDLDLDSPTVNKLFLKERKGYFNDVKHMSDDELLALDRGRHLNKATPKDNKLFEAWFRNMFQPIAGVIRDKVGESAAGLLKRSQLVGQIAVQDYTEGAFKRLAKTGLIQHADDNMTFRGQLLDMANGNLDAGKEVRSYIKHKFGSSVLRTFDDFMAVNKSYQMEYAKRINGKFALDADWMHTQRAADFDRQGRVVTELPYTRQRVKDKSTLNRTRGMFSDNEVNPSHYMNPFVTQHDWAVQHIPLMEFSKSFGLRPASVVPRITQATGQALEPNKTRAIQRKMRQKLKAGAKPSTVKAWGDEQFAKVRKEAVKSEGKVAESTDYIINKAIPERMRKEGYQESQIEEMRRAATSLFVHGNTGASRAVRAIQNIGYASTLGNPYGAAMNLHDVFNSMAVRGIGNTLKGIVRRSGMTVDEAGLMRQSVGEYTALMNKSNKGAKLDKFLDATNTLTEKSMRYGGFEGTDSFGKRSIMGAVLEEAKSNWPAAKAKWGKVFSPSEMLQLERELAKGTKGPLTKQLQLMGLAEQQLISNTGRPGFWLNHPNGRIFYMLTGFAIKQANLIYDQVVRNLLKGNIKQAAKFGAAYIAISGGGYHVVQEGRQPLKGAESEIMSLEKAAYNITQQMLAVATLNRLGGEYNNAQFMRDPGQAAMVSLLPPLGLTGGIMKDLAHTLEGDFVPDSTLKELPVVGKTLFKPMFDSLEE